MQVEETAIPAVKIVTAAKHGDIRGFFSEVYNRAAWDKADLPFTFLQDNHSYSAAKGVLRGLHFQAPPHEEPKLVRCSRGAIHDVIVDLRRDSPTHCRWFAVELSADNRRALYVPPGFAHGFQTLADDTEIFYAMAVAYAPEAARGVRWNDPAFAITWPLAEPIMSERDAGYPDYRP